MILGPIFYFFVAFFVVKLYENLCLPIFLSCGKAFRSFKGFNCGLEQHWTLFYRKNIRSVSPNLKFNCCSCMVKVS